MGVPTRSTCFSDDACGGAGIPAMLIDAAGDLIVGTGDNIVTRLPVSPTPRATLVADPTTATGLNWANSEPFGAITIPGLVPVAVAAFANSANFSRWWGGGTFTRIAYVAGASSGNVCVGSYAAVGAGSNGVPNARQGTSGSVPCPATGWAEITLTAPTTWAAGDFGAIVWDNSSAGFHGHPPPAGAKVQRGLSYFQNSAFPLPATTAVVAGDSSDRVTRLWGIA